MDEARTTAAIQQYLHHLAELNGDSLAEPVVRELLSRAVGRLHFLCSTLLHRNYPRLVRGPLNLQADELLGALAERLLKSIGKVRPKTVREFFGLANQHMRWELNDVARRLDEQEPDLELDDAHAIAAENSDSSLGTNAKRMLSAIDNLPDHEREAFSLVRIQGLTHAEAAEITCVSLKTIQRRLNRSRLLLAEVLADLQPGYHLNEDKDSSPLKDSVSLP
jgi:RNA polymerase sigma factor (sigma-70 family)